MPIICPSRCGPTNPKQIPSARVRSRRQLTTIAGCTWDQSLRQLGTLIAIFGEEYCRGLTSGQGRFPVASLHGNARARFYRSRGRRAERDHDWFTYVVGELAAARAQLRSDPRCLGKHLHGLRYLMAMRSGVGDSNSNRIACDLGLTT